MNSPMPEIDWRRDEDRRLVERCLNGDQQGWEQLYEEHHGRLLRTIDLFLGPGSGGPPLADEIAARVWFALVRNHAALLASYDPKRHSRLASFLAGLARIEVLRYLRSEYRRKRHERTSGCRSLEQERVADWEVSRMIDEFAATLSPAEREFLEEDLIAPREGGNAQEARRELSPSNVWQRRHRIRAKLRKFFEED